MNIVMSLLVYFPSSTLNFSTIFTQKYRTLSKSPPQMTNKFLNIVIISFTVLTSLMENDFFSLKQTLKVGLADHVTKENGKLWAARVDCPKNKSDAFVSAKSSQKLTKLKYSRSTSCISKLDNF